MRCDGNSSVCIPESVKPHHRLRRALTIRGRAILAAKKSESPTHRDQRVPSRNWQTKRPPWNRKRRFTKQGGLLDRTPGGEPFHGLPGARKVATRNDMAARYRLNERSRWRSIARESRSIVRLTPQKDTVKPDPVRAAAVSRWTMPNQ